MRYDTFLFLVKLIGNTGVNIRHRISRFGKLIANVLRLFAGKLLRDTVDSKILCIDAVLLSE